MITKILDYEIINHGYDHAQYFQGCGAAFTSFDVCFTGAANNAKDAYIDALEQVYSTYGDAADRLPKRPIGIRKSDHVPAKLLQDDFSEFYWYVSIRLQILHGRDVTLENVNPC